MPVSRLLARRAVPWLLVLEVLKASKDHWDTLDPRDRERLVTLLRASKGRAANLSTSERAELREIARRLELVRLGRTVGTTAVMGRRGGRRR